MSDRSETMHGGGGIRALAGALALTALLLLPAPSAFAAEPPEELAQLGGAGGSGAGQLNVPWGSTADPVTGQIYVPDAGNQRISEFTPWGEFIKAFGWNVAPGAVNELQEVRLRASSGSFELGFEGAHTPDLPFNATAKEVKDALDALPAIGEAGGEVVVTEQPGNAVTATPFVWRVVFKGSLQATDVPQLEAGEGATPLSGGAPTTGVEARTQADGVGAGHIGLEACTTESGCQAGVEGVRGGQIAPSEPVAVDSSGDIYVSESFNDFNDIHNIHTDNHPAFSKRIQEFDSAGRFLRTWGGDTIADGAAGTGVLTPGSTEVASVATTEKVFREGQPIEGTGIEAGTRIESVGEGTITLSQPATGAATGATTAISSPAGAGNIPFDEVQTIALGSNTTGGTFALKFETADPSHSSAISEAIPASATATELEAKLVALSNVEAGDVEVAGPAGGPWTVRFTGARYGDSNVEALTPSATNLTVGSGEKKVAVSSENAAEVCEVAGDCQGGAEGVAQGQFNEAPAIVLSLTGKLLAADANRQAANRIQSFSTEGAFESEVGVPGKPIRSLTVAPGSGDLYATYQEGDPSELIGIIDPATGAEVGSRKLLNAALLATDPAGNLWVVVGYRAVPHVGSVEHVAELDAEGHQLLPNAAEEEGCVAAEKEFEVPCPFFAALGVGGGSNQLRHIGIGTGPAGDIFVSTRGEIRTNEQFVTIYGPPPAEFEAPPAAAPSIEAQYAATVDATSAEVGAQINPHFWADTTYYLEYGTHPCSEGGCATKPLPPGSLLTSKVSSEALASTPIVLEGLVPGTTYHYRFVARSSGGGPVTGRGGSESEAGEEATFTTAREPGEAQGCANDALRTGAATALPDCRAYEMVSPVDKEGADVLALAPEAFSQPLQQAASSGGRLVFASRRSFGDAASAPFISQYLAARGPEGWSTHAITTPQGEPYAATGDRLNSEFLAFSPDLCEGWLQRIFEPRLSPSAPAGYDDLYRRTDSECGGPSYEPMNTAAPLSAEPFISGFEIGFEGASADGSKAFFVANDKLAPGGAEGSSSQFGVAQLYARAAGESQPRLACVLPSGTPVSGYCTAGWATDPGVFQNGKLPGDFSGAVSEDGSKVYWTDGSKLTHQSNSLTGPIYLRERPTAAQSALAHGAATGQGHLSEGSNTVTSLVAARGKADLLAGSAKIQLGETSIGEFVAGQPIAGAGIPAGTTVASAEGSILTLSAAVEAGKSASGATVSSKGPMPFEVGQTVSAAGLPKGTTISALAEGTLTLSAQATTTRSGVALTASSECSEAARACTIPVSLEAEQQSGAEGSEFRAGAADGSAAIFLNGGGLYEFSLTTQSTQKIAGRVLGVMGASKDLGRIYLASEEALAPGGTAGEPDLYLYEAAAGGHFTFVAALAERDVSGAFFATPFSWELQSTGFPHTSRVSPDGLHAAFMSFGRPSGYDNTDLSTGRPDAEVYLYDAGTGKLACASCNPSGARPRAGGDEEGIPIAAQIPGYESSQYAARVLSGDGSRLFFESYDALLPTDTNGAEDVYEWEAPESGSCSEASPAYAERNGGCIYLISTGKSPSDSNFVDASPSGADAFFTTDESLLPQDPGLRDVYDARVGGGFPPPQGTPPACEGEGCQPASSPPNDQTPASAAFRGAGNLSHPAKPRCRKGTRQVRRKGKARCLKRQKPAHRRHARHHKRRHGARKANRDRGGRR